MELHPESSDRLTMLKSLYSKIKNGATPLGGEIDAFEDDDNYQEENSIELNAEAISYTKR